MKILLIAHACQMRAEGQQRAQCLGALPGVDLRVVVPDRWMEYGTWRLPQQPLDPTYTFQVEKIRWPWTGPAQWYFHSYPKLGKILRAFRPDVIDLWEEPWGLVSAQAVRLRNRLLPSAKIVVETEANINRHHPFPFTTLRRYVLRHADFAVTRQTEGISVLRAHGYHGPVRFVGNGVDAQLFSPRDRAACKRALGLGDFVVGYVGRLIEAKGLMDAVEALAQCPLPVNLLFVGGGIFQPALEQRAAELGLAERVKFLPPRAMAELPEAMNAMDALLLVSRTTRTWKEQFGRVIIEAQACGTPVIGSDSGSIPEIVGAGGIIVPEGNSTALAGAIQQLYNNPNLAANLGRLGREQVEAHYTWQRVAEQMHGIYT
ncbi:MAG: glycosyltransferase, partial [Gluconacetobacter diazotrophicus]|nr:glycosyltransferase [Gluconacetobacter diazotrophicus]